MQTRCVVALYRTVRIKSGDWGHSRVEQQAKVVALVVVLVLLGRVKRKECISTAVPDNGSSRHLAEEKEEQKPPAARQTGCPVFPDATAGTLVLYLPSVIHTV